LALKGTLVVGEIQPAGMAHHRVVFADNSTAACERFDLSHSIKQRSVPMAREPHSPRIPSASEALAGAGAEAAIERHIMSNSPTVLCSPAMTEGLDLRDHLSRFQVIVKVPYPPFTDPYVAARKRLDKGWYSWQTAMRLIQATGRSVRSETDFAETYIVDSSFGDIRRLNQRLLPAWWRAAVVDVGERKPVSSAKPTQPVRDRRLF
jgi:Rad3-related DNA helicase